MLLSANAFRALLWIVLGLAALAVLGLIAAKWLAALRLGGTRLVLALVAVLGVVGLFALVERSAQILVVSGRAGDMRATRHVQIGSASYRTQARAVALTLDHEKTWVVNDSTEVVLAILYQYAPVAIPIAERPMRAIGPGEADVVATRRIEHVGPGGRPPEAMQAAGGFAQRWWLTWGALPAD